MLKPSEPVVFIETSTQIARLLSEKAKATSIEQALTTSKEPVVTSDYVLMEYQRTLIADFAHVHWAFQQAQTMGEAMRSLTRCGQIAGLACGEREVVQLTDATHLLDLYLQVLLLRTF